MSLLPAGSHGLVLSPEVDCSLSVEVSSSQVRFLVSGEGEHRKRYRDRQINSDLTGFNFVLELTCHRAVLSEDRAPVSIRVVVDNLKRLSESVNTHDVHHGSEDLSVVGLLPGAVSVNDSRSDEVSVREAGDFGFSTVKENLLVRVL